MNWAGRMVQQEVSANDSVLDLGCGIMQATLDQTSQLQTKCLVGVDIYSQYLKFLRDKHISVLRADVSKPLPFRDKCFDHVLLMDVVEHLEYKEAFQLMDEAEKIAIKKVIVLTPFNFMNNIEATDEVSPYCGMGKNPYQLHKCLITPRDLQRRGFRLYPKISGRKYTYTFAVKEQ